MKLLPNITTTTTFLFSTTTTFLFTTTHTFTAPNHPTQTPLLPPCAPMLTLHLYINDLDTYPTQAGIYMAQAQALLVDAGLHCPTTNGILNNDEGTETASEACKKNQEIKDVLEGLKISSPDEKRAVLRALRDACVVMDGLIGCPTG